MVERDLNCVIQRSTFAPEEEPCVGAIATGEGKERAEVGEQEHVVDGDIVEGAVVVVYVCARQFFDEPFLLQLRQSFVGYGVDHLGAAAVGTDAGGDTVEVSRMEEFLEAPEDLLVGARRERLNVGGGKEPEVLYGF